MSKEVKVRSGGITFTGVLAVLFIALKLTGHITWSWLWVLSPIWLPTTIILGCIVVYFLIALILLAIANLLERIDK